MLNSFIDQNKNKLKFLKQFIYFLLIVLVFNLGIKLFVTYPIDQISQNNIGVVDNIIYIDTKKIKEKKINQLYVQIDFNFSKYNLYDNLLQTDEEGKGIRIEISPNYSMSLVQYTKNIGFSANNIIDKLILGHDYELKLKIINNVVKIEILDKTTNKLEKRKAQLLYFPSISNFWIGAGFSNERKFSGRIDNFSINFNYLPQNLYYLVNFVLGFILMIYLIKSNVKIYNFLMNNYKSLVKMVFYVLIGLLFLTAFIVRFNLINVPFSGPDTIGYLGVALQYIESQHFTQIAERSYPYPLFLTGLLHIKFIGIITIIQHLFGLFAGFLFLLIARKINKEYLELSFLLNVFYWLFSSFVLFILLFNEWTINIEHHTHPESLTNIMMMLLIYTYLKFYENLSTRYAIFFYATLFFMLNYLFFIFQPRYGINVILISLIYLFLLVKTNNIKKVFLIFIVSCFSTFVLLILPFSEFSNKTKSNINLKAAIFFHNIKIIEPIIKMELNNKQLSFNEKNLLLSILEDYDEAKKESNNYGTGFNKSLGFNTDYFNKTYYRLFDFYADDVIKFYDYYIIKAIKNDPFGLINKIIIEFKYFYNDDVLFEHSTSKKDLYKYSYDTISGFKSHFPNSKILNEYINYLDYLRNTEYSSSFDDTFGFVYKTSIIIKKLYMYVSIIFVIFFIFNFFKDKFYYKFSLILLLLFSIQLGFNITISIFNTNSVSRYISDQFIIITISEIMAIFFILLIVFKYLNKLVKEN